MVVVVDVASLLSDGSRPPRGQHGLPPQCHGERLLAVMPAVAHDVDSAVDQGETGVLLLRQLEQSRLEPSDRAKPQSGEELVARTEPMVDGARRHTDGAGDVGDGRLRAMQRDGVQGAVEDVIRRVLRGSCHPVTVCLLWTRAK